MEHTMRRYASLIFFLVLVFGGGSLIGAVTAPGEWYRGLDKPWFNPPDWLFGPAWGVLYVLIAVAGWRTWTRDRTGPAMRIWWLQLALNFLWSPTFFAMQWIGGGLTVVLAMLASIVAFIVVSWRSDRVASVLFVPYAAWVSFASLLNAAILLLN
jgi:translocator protein